MSRVRNDARRERLIAEWPVNVRVFAEQENTSPGAIYRLARDLGLKTKARRYDTRLGPLHRAIRGRTTKYPSTVISAKASKRVLVPGSENRKLGKTVTVGRLAGSPIYQVTLVERLTCPITCLTWHECYGNGMNWARRHRLDPELIKRLDVELDIAAARHPGGFLVRLHTLGDFGQGEADGLPYVAFWRAKMLEQPALHVFGFTAHDRASPVGAALMRLNRQFPDRCRIRFSGTASDDGFGALVIDHPGLSRHVICPWESERERKPSDCGACGLCWSMRPTVEFLVH